MRATAWITTQPKTRPSEPGSAEDALQQGRDGERTLAADCPPAGELSSGGTRAFANGSEAFCGAEADPGPVVMRIAEPALMADLSAYLNAGVSVATLKGALAEARAAVDQDKAPAVPAPAGKDDAKPGSGEKEGEAPIPAALAAGAGEPNSTDQTEARSTAVWPPLKKDQTATFNAMPADEDVETDMAAPELAEAEDARASHADAAAPVASGGALVRAEHRATGPQAPDEWRSRERAPSPLGWASIAQLVVLVLLPVVVAALGAFAVASQGERVHAARSEIVFDLRNVAWGAAERFLETQAVVARSRTLLAPIADAFAIPIAELDRAFVVEAVRDSDVIRLEYAHPDPVLARNVTKAITDRYLVNLREFERLDGTRHRLLTPAFVLDEPVAPKPLRAAAMGAAIGLMIGLIALILRIQAWLPQRS